MSRRIKVMLLLATLLLAVACTNKKVSNPIANVDSKQPDKVLFDRAMDAMKHNRFDVARITLQTMINTSPDSEYIARAKLAVADSWYAEGGTASLAQAETEYNDFKTFFPNMAEAAEAQLKIANIHYQQMEKPDRDYTHAMRAEEEYRNLILQFPDSKLVPQAKQKLMQVQEVLAEKEYEVGHFYFNRQSYAAAIARLQTLVDRYPLYSRADDALYLLGQSYEGEATTLRSRPTCDKAGKPLGCVLEGPKAAMLKDVEAHAAQAYSRILTRYPLMDRADDAKARLIALKQPVPRPTKAAVAENRAEESSRKEMSTLSKVTHIMDRHPDGSHASGSGDPTLVDPQPMSATEVVQQASRAGLSAAGLSKDHTISIEAAGSGAAPPANEAAPRSDDPASPPTAASDASAAAPPDSNELKPNVDSTPDPNELKPNVPADSAAAPPPQQVNEINNSGPDASTGGSQSSATAQNSAASDSELADDNAIASSKPKKKKGLHRIVPF